MGQATERAYGEIKERILNGQLAPHMSVDEPAIAKELGMSRTPVREALLRLQSESYVEIARGKGIRVLPISTKDMREAYQTISGLEMVAVQLLAQMRPTRDYLEPLYSALEALQQTKDHDVSGWCNADESFHRELLKLSGNSKLCALGLQLREFASRGHAVAVKLQSAEYKDISTKNHAKLVHALENGEYEQAIDKHLLQRQRGEEALIGSLEALNLHSL